MSEWSEGRELDWWILDQPAHRQLQDFVGALNRAYRDRSRAVGARQRQRGVLAAGRTVLEPQRHRLRTPRPPRQHGGRRLQLLGRAGVRLHARAPRERSVARDPQLRCPRVRWVRCRQPRRSSRPIRTAARRWCCRPSVCSGWRTKPRTAAKRGACARAGREDRHRRPVRRARAVARARRALFRRKRGEEIEQSRERVLHVTADQVEVGDLRAVRARRRDPRPRRRGPRRRRRPARAPAAAPGRGRPGLPRRAGSPSAPARTRRRHGDSHRPRSRRTPLGAGAGARAPPPGSGASPTGTVPVTPC